MSADPQGERSRWPAAGDKPPPDRAAPVGVFTPCFLLRPPKLTRGLIPNATSFALVGPNHAVTACRIRRRISDVCFSVDRTLRHTAHFATLTQPAGPAH